MSTAKTYSQEEVAALEAEVARLKAKRKVAVTVKLSSKGAISVYGLGRFPVTLYKSQMETLLGMNEQIRKFISENAEGLKTKE
jgi:hypothetical protein